MFRFQESHSWFRAHKRTRTDGRFLFVCCFPNAIEQNRPGNLKRARLCGGPFLPAVFFLLRVVIGRTKEKKSAQDTLLPRTGCKATRFAFRKGSAYCVCCYASRGLKFDFCDDHTDVDVAGRPTFRPAALCLFFPRNERALAYVRSPPVHLFQGASPKPKKQKKNRQAPSHNRFVFFFLFLAPFASRIFRPTLRLTLSRGTRVGYNTPAVFPYCSVGGWHRHRPGGIDFCFHSLVPLTRKFNRAGNSVVERSPLHRGWHRLAAFLVGVPFFLDRSQ